MLGSASMHFWQQTDEKLIRLCCLHFTKFSYRMSLKLHFFSHFEYFPDNFSDFREEMGERFHEDIKIVETRYQG